MDLIIVESPSKAKTIEKYLGKGFMVDASGGHIRDLPEKRMGINFDKNFEPKYEIIAKKKEDIKRLQQKCKKADKIFLATDPDREGEAISWHLAEALKIDTNQDNRIVFNEISQKAVKQALTVPRKVDMNLVDAQQARRILDRLVGYSISPILSRRLESQLSAGRVQSVALKLIVDREREILNFVPVEYWNIKAEVENKEQKSLKALLYSFNGKKFKPKNKEETDKVLADVENGIFKVKSVKKSVTASHAPPPFTTSTMQQDASNKMSMTATQIMQLAQHLYEGIETNEGHLAFVTYIRTDSTRVSLDAQQTALSYIKEKYGDNFVPEKPNFYKTKKDAQDAHEAIRPIDITKTPESVKHLLDRNHFRLYKLIYERFIASQMSSAKYNTVNLEIENGNYLFKTTGKTLLFKGYTIVYDDTVKSEDDEEGAVALLPELNEGEILQLIKMHYEQKFTKPPTRYTDSTMVKLMEEKGIGRPSTYATIVGILSFRKYTKKQGKFILPTEIAFDVVDFLVKYFEQVMNVKFTSEMEEKLDDIGISDETWQDIVRAFYEPFSKQLDDAQLTDEICDKCGSRMYLKSGRYGDYYACSSYPDCQNIKKLKESKEAIPTDEICEKCGSMMLEREGKYGKFLACSNFPKCKNTKTFEEEKFSDVPCEKCGGKTVFRVGKFGQYLKCKECEHNQAIDVIEGVCPVCHSNTKKLKGKSGKFFYACTKYPECDFRSWDKPTGEKCTVCNFPMVEVNQVVKCSNKKCESNKVKEQDEN